MEMQGAEGEEESFRPPLRRRNSLSAFVQKITRRHSAPTVATDESEITLFESTETPSWKVYDTVEKRKVVLRVEELGISISLAKTQQLELIVPWQHIKSFSVSARDEEFAFEYRDPSLGKAACFLNKAIFSTSKCSEIHKCVEEQLQKMVKARKKQQEGGDGNKQVNHKRRHSLSTAESTSTSNTPPKSAPPTRFAPNLTTIEE